MSLLEVREISKQFGGLAALSKVDMTVEEGEIRGVIGPNGAGKTTLLRIITNQLAADDGQIRLGQNVRVGYYYAAGAAAVLALAPAVWPWGAFLLWPAAGLGMVAAAYFGLGPGIFRKDQGRLPFAEGFEIQLDGVRQLAEARQEAAHRLVVRLRLALFEKLYGARVRRRHRLGSAPFPPRLNAAQVGRVPRFEGAITSRDKTS